LTERDKQFNLIQTDVVYGFLFLLSGLIGLPSFIKFDKDSVNIMGLSKKQIKYNNLIDFDYNDNLIVFETKELKYELKVFNIDTDRINKLKSKIKNYNNNVA